MIRDNILGGIEKQLGGDTEAILVEGDEGIGKTTLLAQFALRHPSRSLCLFIRSTSRWAYDPDILLRDLCNQMHVAVSGQELAAEVAADDRLFRTLLYELQRRARRTREPYYFVVDGLQDIPKEHRELAQAISAMLPWGLPGFRFVLSTGQAEETAYVPDRVPMKAYPVYAFNLDETKSYLYDVCPDPAMAEEFYRTFSGFPDSLASIRRIIQSGEQVDSVLTQLPERHDLFQVEWRKVPDDSSLRLALAVIAQDAARHTIADVARIVRSTQADLEQQLSALPFIRCDGATGILSFAAETFRKFAALQLGDLRIQALELLIEDLESSPDSETALLYLPAYLQQAGRLSDLVTYLSPEHFTRLLERSESLIPVSQKLDLGISTARQIGRAADMTRFSLQRSIVRELEGAEVWRSEIEARMVLNDYDAALSLAQSTLIREDRLHLLAVIAKAKRQQGLAPEPELLEQIRGLYKQIDIAGLSERAVSIATDLFHAAPDLAIDMVERATSSSDQENTLDWAFAKLSVSALQSADQHPDYLETVNTIRSQISDPGARRLSEAAFLLLGKYSAQQVLVEAARLDEARDRLYVLAHWCMLHPRRGDAHEVVAHALDHAITATKYSPNATILRQIATPLPHVGDVSKLKDLVGSFDSQKGSVERLGPTEDYVRLQLLLAASECTYDRQAAANRIIETYFYISELGDCALKSACLSRLMTSTGVTEAHRCLEREGLQDLAKDDLERVLTELLGTTADHYTALRGTVRALARRDLPRGRDVALRANTEARRDLLLFDAVDAAFYPSASEFNAASVISTLEKISDTDVADQALCIAIERISGNQSLCSDAKRALPLINRISTIRDAGLRCKAASEGYLCLSHSSADEFKSLQESLLGLIENSWNSIDVAWHRVNVGFHVSHVLAGASIEAAKNFLSVTQAYRQEILLDDSTTSDAYLACLRLAIRSFSGLFQSKLDSREDLERLTDLIDLVPSAGERARLLSELSLRFHMAGRIAECHDITNSRVRPLVQSISDNDRVYKTNVVISTAPALFIAHPTTAKEMILSLQPADRDSAYSQICEYLLRKQVPTDPYEGLRLERYDVRYEGIVDIVSLMELMDLDGQVYHYTRVVANCMDSPSGRKRYTEQQRADVVRRLTEVVAKRLPNRRHIQHQGYSIAARAQILRIRRGNSKAWADLADEARGLGNIADRCYVLALISAAMPLSHDSARRQLFAEARELVSEIPSRYDQIQHYEALASFAMEFDTVLVKDCLQMAMNAAVSTDGASAQAAQRRIVDMAHRLDAELASSLASLADNDPARGDLRSGLERQIQVLDLRKKIADKIESGVERAGKARRDYPEAAVMLLGSLNANRLEPVHFEKVVPYIPLVARYPVHEAVAILSWIVENAIRRIGRTDQAKLHLVPLFGAVMASTELAAKLACRSELRSIGRKTLPGTITPADSILVRAGEREAGLDFLRAWIKDQASGYVKICDPYFGPSDLEVLQLIRSVNADCDVAILSSRKHHSEQVAEPWEQTYRDKWRIDISDQDPPPTEVLIVGTKSGGDLPIHDRWWLTSNGGIRIGTSFNGLGRGRDSEISILSADEAALREADVDQYFDRAKREHDGQRLLYSLITL
ncbi:MAG: AAA family ATPase [Armatimonadota bacterium]